MQTEIRHQYGPQVHILDNAFLNGLLAELCSPKTFQPKINHLVEMLYFHLLMEVMNKEFKKETVSLETRMTETHPDQRVQTTRIDSKQKVISVNLARAGTYPSHVCYNSLHYAIDPQNLRQDHIFAARATNLKSEVTGTDISSSKIGGDKDNSIVLIPDPMGATGNTIISAMDVYKNSVAGKAYKFIALHLIITPEYLKKVTASHPETLIYSIRLDRGLSPKAVLEAPPGKYWDQEKGLNEKHYIVPGGGGFGEIMNNSFV